MTEVPAMFSLPRNVITVVKIITDHLQTTIINTHHCFFIRTNFIRKFRNIWENYKSLFKQRKTKTRLSSTLLVLIKKYYYGIMT